MSEDMMQSESNRLVRASRAGDRFHYCWAAKRSLLLLHPKSRLKRIVIEGDDPSGTPGEYSLDMTEVYREGSDCDRIKYQFKYSVERVNEPFTFSELKKTIVGFSQNYHDLASQGKKLRYVIITNRGVSNELKSCVETVAKGTKAIGRTADSFYHNVELKDDELRQFCSLLEFRDVEGDLEAQFQDLRVRAASYTAGTPTETSMHALVDMVACKALPKSDGVITQEDVLSYFCKGVTSMAAFYPAPAKFDAPEEWIETSGYKDVRSRVLSARRNVFIHAPGGVGKTVTLRMLASDIPSVSAAVLFDCFAAGEYANLLQYRHTPEKACVQIANELAVMELCDPLVVDNGISTRSVFEAFFHRVKCAVDRLRRKNADARLYLFIDAADNAHMMAVETGEPCFVDCLLESSSIDGCTVVFSARTGRMNDFWPDRDYEDIELTRFTRQEVGAVLRRKFHDAPFALVKSLFVLTSGIPRIVAGILADCKSLKEVAKAVSFEPIKGYDSYLESKYRATLKRYSKTERKKLERLCRCLVILPPNVPINVLATAANVTDDFILGFISDWERPLWHSQEYVHFRDEPTETWFRNKFGENQGDLEEVIDLVSPLSNQFVYVARSLPSLLLRAKAYDKLETLAESDEFLPEIMHTAERRQLRLERLRFAVSAMIRSKKFASAMRLSLLAGGMVSESGRRKEMVRRELVFASRVFPKETLVELAATQQVCLSWPGSENLCTGVLLSALPDTHDEVGIHIESANHWLFINFEREREEKESNGRLNLHNSDYAHEASLFGSTLLMTNGPQAAVDDIGTWNSKATRYRAASFLADDCVSLGEKVSVERMLHSAKDVFISLGLLSGALDYGCEIEFPEWQKVVRLVLRLSDDDTSWRDDAKAIRLSVARFAVWVARHKGGSRMASTLLEKCVLPYFRFRTHDFPYDSDDALPLYVLSKTCQKKRCSVSDIMGDIKKAGPAIPDYELRRTQDRFELLLPLYVKMVEAYLSADETKIASALTDVVPCLNDYHLFQQDKQRLFIDFVSWLSNVAAKDADCLLEFVDQNARVGLVSASALIELSRRLCRRGHMKTGEVCLSRGTDCFELCRKDPNVTPDELSDLYIQAAKACYPYDADDARGYFSEAFDVLSKCGDELLPRWETVTAIARRLSQPDTRKCVSQKLVYDFTRCGDYVRKCVVRDKYYNWDEVFSILTDFDPSYSWGTYSRWRDRGVGSFCGDLNWVLKDLLKKGAMTVEEAWSFRAFGDYEAVLNAVVEMQNSREFKQRVFDDLLSTYGKTGCSRRSLEMLKRLAQQLGTTIPIELHVHSDGFPRQFGDVSDNNSESVGLASFDGHDPNWAYTTLSLLKGIWNQDHKFDLFFSKVPNRLACPLLRQLAVDTQLDQFDINDILEHLPIAWWKKPGLKETMPGVLSKLMERYVKEGWYHYIGELLACAEKFGFGQKLTEFFLNCTTNVVSLGSAEYFQVVKAGIRVLAPSEIVDVFDYALRQVADGMDREFGDGEWHPSMWPDKPFNEVTKDVLWTAMGDPDVRVRWKATHCVVNELLRLPENVAGYVKRLPDTDFTPCVAKGLPTYIYFSRMHFLLALAKVSRQIAPQIRANASELIAYLQGQDHVLIRFLGWKALVDAGVPGKTLLGVNPLEGMAIQKVDGYSWRVQSVVHPRIKEIIDNGGWIPLQYDFEKYWLQSLAYVFGLGGNDCQALLQWASLSVEGNDYCLIRDQDPRRDQLHDCASSCVSDSDMPDVSDYNFYISYHSLMILAGKLLKYQPVLKCRDDEEDRLSSWLKARLSVFSPDLGTWQSDVRGNLPEAVAQGDELRKMVEQKSLMEIDIVKLLQLSGRKDKLLIDGHWRIADYAKVFECSLSSALVPQKSAESTRMSLRSLKDPMSLALPTLFDDPNDDCWNHGNYDWRGLFDSEPEYPRYHLDEKDPAAGGLHLVRFHIAKSIYKSLQLKDDGDHFSISRKDGSPALVSLYWSYGSQSAKPPETYGCTLEATTAILAELCVKYQSELIIELVLKRYTPTYRYGNPSPDEEEKCYRYVLFSPEKGVY